MARPDSLFALSVRERNAVRVASVAYGAALAALAAVRFRNVWPGALDMGVFTQGGWLVAHGHAHISIVGRNLFTDHVSPMYALLAPLFMLWSSSYALIVVQAIAVAASTPPLYRLLRANKATTRTAVVLVFLSSSLLSAAMFDFHASTIAVPFIAWGVVAIQEGRSRLLIAMAIAIVLCRTDLLLVVLAFALLAPKQKYPLIAIAAVGAGLSMLPAFFGGGTLWEVNYGKLGTSPVDALLHPWRLARVLFTIDQIGGILTKLIAVGFLALLSPRRLLAVVIAALPILLSGARTVHLPWFQYTAPLTPLLYFAAIDLNNLRPKLSLDLRNRIMVIGAIVSLLVFSPVSPGAPDNLRLINVLRMNNDAAFATIINAIPPNAGVSADDPVAAQLAQRMHLYLYPSPFVNVGPEGPEPTAALRANVTYVAVPLEAERKVRSYGFTREVVRSGNWIVLQRG